MKKRSLILFMLAISPVFAYSQDLNSSKQNEIFWRITSKHSITWNLTNESRLPHDDNIEMSGQKVAAIISYEVDKDKNLHVTRDVIFPQLRVFIKSSEPNWRNYRAYLRSEYDDEILPVIVIDDRTYELGQLDSVRINGTLECFHGERQGLKVARTFLPSMTDRLFIEKWTITNVSDTIKQINFGHTGFSQEQVRHEFIEGASGEVRMGLRQASNDGPRRSAHLCVDGYGQRHQQPRLRQ